MEAVQQVRVLEEQVVVVRKEKVAVALEHGGECVSGSARGLLAGWERSRWMWAALWRCNKGDGQEGMADGCGVGRHRSAL